LSSVPRKRVKGNRVKVSGDPVTVNRQQFAKTIAPKA